MKKISLTIRDVAAQAGVSVGTVSKYINGAQRFSAPVEEKIKEAIDLLGYRSNPLAQSMITGRTRAIGLAILDIGNPHFTSIVKGANRVALQHGYTLLLVDIEENQEHERPLIEALSQRVDGLLVSSRLTDDASQWLLDLRKPVVLLRTGKLPIPSVGIDNRLAGYMLARHLLDQGYRQIAYLGFEHARVNADRIAGARECLAQVGLELDIFEAHAPTAIAGEQSCSRVMLGNKRPEAVICYNDLIALGFMKEAANVGIRVPTDVAVAGIDNVLYGAYTNPGLTTIDVQSETTGGIAMQKLVDALANQANHDEVILEPRLVMRGSTARRPLAD